MKRFNGKAIYNPSGKAAEYSAWACNFYVGCSNGCEYCYCKKGLMAGVMGQDKPQLKKCFRDVSHALGVFEKELNANLVELQKYGLFFSFTTDPMLPETIWLTKKAAEMCEDNDIPVKILTKCTEWVEDFASDANIFESEDGSQDWRKMYAFGFTLTGHDELEPGASTNEERICAMINLYEAGFKTFASIEPIVELISSWDMIANTVGYCDMYKIGLMSGQKYDKFELQNFMNRVSGVTNAKIPLYFKDSFLLAAGVSRKDLPENCVGRDFKLHNK
jgi:DNA repair photolyase